MKTYIYKISALFLAFSFLINFNALSSSTCSTTPIPGGGMVTFSSNRDGTHEIYVMNDNECNAIQITNDDGEYGYPVWSADGELLMFSSGGIVYIMSADGSTRNKLFVENPGYQTGAVFSPDGTKVSLQIDTGGQEIFIVNIDGTGLQRLTFTPYNDNFRPSWSPDGSLIYFSSRRTGSGQVWVMNADGTNQHALKANDGYYNVYAQISPDGNKIVFLSTRDGNYEIYIMDSNGSNEKRLTYTTANEQWPAWSPDSTRIVFYSNQNGNEDLYVMNADGSNQTRITDDPENDIWPSWGGPKTLYSLSGVVLDANHTGQAIEGANVSIGSNSDITDENGRYSLNVYSGDHQISVTRIGYIPQITHRNIQGDTMVDFTLLPKDSKGLKQINGWISEFDYLNGRTSFKNNPEVFSTINPVWWFISPTDPKQLISADLISDTNTIVNDQELLDTASINGVEVIPVIGSKSITHTITMLDNYREHITNIINMVNAQGYQGIEIDYEGLGPEYKDRFTTFVRELSTDLHKNGKKLTVAIPGINGPFAYHGAYDYYLLGWYADFVKIMAYDDSLASPINTYPTHHASIGWVTDVLNYASWNIPKEKLILGIPTYGYRWRYASQEQKWYIDGGETYQGAVDLAKLKGVLTIQRDMSLGSIPYFTYTENETYLQYYEDAISTEVKINQGLQKNIYGFAIWRLGGEDPALEKSILASLNAQPPGNDHIIIQSGSATNQIWNVISWGVVQARNLFLSITWERNLTNSLDSNQVIQYVNADCSLLADIYRPDGTLYGSMTLTEPTTSIFIDEVSDVGTWQVQLKTTCENDQFFTVVTSQASYNYIYLPFVRR